MEQQGSWYVVQLDNGQCDILKDAAGPESSGKNLWGPYASKQDAIARRVGLIRAGKCQPAP